jgi:hypothetical protein
LACRRFPALVDHDADTDEAARGEADSGGPGPPSEKNGRVVVPIAITRECANDEKSCEETSTRADLAAHLKGSNNPLHGPLNS